MRGFMKKGCKIAILLRHPCQLSDACSCGRAFLEIGAAVSYYCLCRASDPEINWNIKPLLDTQAPCFTDSLDLALQYELKCLSFRDVVQGIESADWIIPI